MRFKGTRRVRGTLTVLVASLMSMTPVAAASSQRAQNGQGGHTGHAAHGGAGDAAASKPARPEPAKPPAERAEDGMVGAVDASMSRPDHDHGNMNAALHMELTPTRPPTRADSVRAESVLAELRRAIAKYRDTAVAVADGYQMFMPNLKNQRVYHFTNYRRAFAEAFRFDARKPTSLLYRRGADGRLELLGAMYTAPKRVSVERLDQRVPLSITRWHKHVNWCVPGRGQRERWLEKRDGHPVFGPQSPIATREACDEVGGRFLPSIFGWMVHVNAFASDPAEIWKH
jgi:hypothetical protein